jgi:hypothetical protein
MFVTEQSWIRLFCSNSGWQTHYGSGIMNNMQIIGIVLLIVGGILLFFGYQASQSVSEQVVETFTGRFTDETTWYFILGAASSVGGILLLFFRS